MFATISRLWAAILTAGLMLAATAAEARRVALVIGNSAYTYAPPLANPANDAADMAARLRQLGFEVIEGRDLRLNDLRLKVREFVDRLNGADIGLFFYAGHGLQVEGRNYIAPVEARLESRDDLSFEAMEFDFILTAMERKTRTNLVFLDACRNNPLSRNLARSMGTRSAAVGRGLARMETGVGTMIAYATQPGNVALDGQGRNSPFTAALMNHLGEPGDEIATTMRKVRTEVLASTNGEQVPWENSSLTGAVILNTLQSIDKGVKAVEKQVERSRDSDVEIAYWNSIAASDDPAYFAAYLRKYPNGQFAELARLKMGQAGGAQPAAPRPQPQVPAVQAKPADPPPQPTQTARLSPPDGEIVSRQKLNKGFSDLTVKARRTGDDRMELDLTFTHDELRTPFRGSCKVRASGGDECFFNLPQSKTIRLRTRLPEIAFEFTAPFHSAVKTFNLW